MHAVGDEHLGAVQHVVRRRRARARVRIAATSEPAPGSVTPTAVMVLPAMTPGRYFSSWRLVPKRTQMRARHVGVDQHGDGEAAMGRAADLLGEHDRGAGIEARAAQRLGHAQGEEAEPAHLAQHVARHEARLLPLRPVRASPSPRRSGGAGRG